MGRPILSLAKKLTVGKFPPVTPVSVNLIHLLVNMWTNVIL